MVKNIYYFSMINKFYFFSTVIGWSTGLRPTFEQLRLFITFQWLINFISFQQLRLFITFQWLINFISFQQFRLFITFQWLINFISFQQLGWSTGLRPALAFYS